jgi:hypothetical protein
VRLREHGRMDVGDIGSSGTATHTVRYTPTATHSTAAPNPITTDAACTHAPCRAAARRRPEHSLKTASPRGPA